MDREEVYEFIEEADKREVMELLDAVINRFRELHEAYDQKTDLTPQGGRKLRWMRPLYCFLRCVHGERGRGEKGEF